MKLRRFISAILVLSTLICMCPTGVFAEDDLVPVEAPEIDAVVDVDAVEITPEADAPAEEIPAEEITAVDETEEADSYLAAESSISNPQIVSDSSMVAGQKVTYSCVWFGSYPQAEVVSSKSMMTTAISEEYLNDNDYIVDATLYSQLESATGWDSNNEITLGGNKYRRMQAADATHVEKDKSWRNPFYYWSDTTTYHYFKYQPIKWRVLSTDGSTALLLADECLDDVVWNSDEDYGNTWATSEMRS